MLGKWNDDKCTFELLECMCMKREAELHGVMWVRIESDNDILGQRGLRHSYQNNPTPQN